MVIFSFLSLLIIGIFLLYNLYSLYCEIKILIYSIICFILEFEFEEFEDILFFGFI